MTVSILSALIGVATAAVLALINSWISSRAGIDENLRSERLKLYPDLWATTAAASRWPRADVTRNGLGRLHTQLRGWYYASGGLFLSKRARDRYGDVQKLIAALLQHPGPRDGLLRPESYDDLMETMSDLRTALAGDLDTRHRKSAGETLRRFGWHLAAARRARARIKRAERAGSPFAA